MALKSIYRIKPTHKSGKYADFQLKIIACWDIANRILKERDHSRRRLPYPNVSYYNTKEGDELSEAVAYAIKTSWLYFNRDYMKDEASYNKVKELVIPHEIAHCFTDYLFKGRKLSDHSAQWSTFANRLAKEYCREILHCELSEKIKSTLAF